MKNFAKIRILAIYKIVLSTKFIIDKKESNISIQKISCIIS